jgi:hypothetical protein
MSSVVNDRNRLFIALVDKDINTRGIVGARERHWNHVCIYNIKT